MPDTAGAVSDAAPSPPPDVVCVLGQTGAGKTRLAVEIALECGGEVVNCDAMQVYAGLPIATAQASAGEMRGVPHHMLGCVDPFANGSTQPSMWCGTPRISPADACAVAMGSPAYTCMASQLTTSPPHSSAISTASRVFPAPVWPRTHTTSGGGDGAASDTAPAVSGIAPVGSVWEANRRVGLTGRRAGA